MVIDVISLSKVPQISNVQRWNLPVEYVLPFTSHARTLFAVSTTFLIVIPSTNLRLISLLKALTHLLVLALLVRGVVGWSRKGSWLPCETTYGEGEEFWGLTAKLLKMPEGIGKLPWKEVGLGLLSGVEWWIEDITDCDNPKEMGMPNDAGWRDASGEMESKVGEGAMQVERRFNIEG